MGLTSEEVRKRIDNGQTNHTDISTQKTVGQIVKSNLLTYFNLIFLILTVLLCIVGSFRNLTFAGHHRQYGYRNISGVACKKDS